MSKPASWLFPDSPIIQIIYGNAEEIIASRIAGLDLQPHPLTQSQLSTKRRKSIAQKIKNRTATREEYNLYMWDKRLRARRSTGVKQFWTQERQRLANGEIGSRNWTTAQREAILNGKPVKYRGKTLQAHHSYSVSQYPHLANRGEVIYPATAYEHHKGWHGGSYKTSRPGKRIRRINEF